MPKGASRKRRLSNSKEVGMDIEPEAEGLWASPTDLFVIDVGDWKYQRPVTEAGRCCQCGICYFFCPTGCIKDMGTYYAADLGYCKGCGICVTLCPVDAIKMEREA